jgi:hypothetical protein
VSDSDKFEQYHELYRDIAFGYSRVLDEDDNPVFVKHLKELEKEYSYHQYKISIENAEREGLAKEKDSIDLLIDQKVWSEKEEKRIEELKYELTGLEETHDKLIIKKQKDSVNEDIVKAKLELVNLQRSRAEHLGLTAEGFASKKQTEDTILMALFKDEELKDRLYSKEEFDLLTDTEVNKLSSLYFGAIFSRFNSDNLRRIAISPFYMSLYNVCNDSIYNFYGKSVLHLTHLQIAVFTMAKYYKQLMQSSKAAPEGYQNSPESLIEWYESQSSLRQVESGKQGGDGGGRSIIGANKEELKSLENDNEEVVDVAKEIEKAGGDMDFDEILKMHGI